MSKSGETREKMMRIARTWLRQVRGEGGELDKRAYLEEKGYTEGELEELMEWEREDSRTLFGDGV